MEREIDKEKLALMDVLISRSEHGFKISLYRKPTFTELYLNFVLHQSKRKSKKKDCPKPTISSKCHVAIQGHMNKKWSV